MKIEVRRERDHYKVEVDGEFWCTCDSMREVDEEIEYIKSVWWKKGEAEIKIIK